MKKYIVLSLAMTFGLFLALEAQQPQDPQQPQHEQHEQQQYQQRVPVEKENLPEEVRETLENEFENWQVVQAYLVSGAQPGIVEGAEGIEEGAGDTGQFYMIQLMKDDKTKTVHIAEDGSKLKDKSKDKDHKRGGAEREGERY
jgi:hypothetical protein